VDWPRNGYPPSHSSGKDSGKMGKTKDIREAVEAELSFDPLVITG
jgi:hypothetical protein